MIRGLHGLVYSSEPEATRAFLRDKLRLPYSDVGEGWLIFDLPEADVGVHPVESGGTPAGTHDVSFYCDDIRGTVADLRARGVQFKGDIADHGYGWVTYLTLPGGVEVQLYEPKYVKRPTAKTGKTKTSARRKRPATSARPAKKRDPKARKRPRAR